MAPTWTGEWPQTLAVALAIVLHVADANQATGQVAAPTSTAVRHGAGKSDPRAAAMFRSATALQDRELFDLAAAEWAMLAENFPSDPLIAKARHYRGVCLVRLDRFAEAEAEFATVIEHHSYLEAALLEQTYANLGFAQYNRARAAKGAQRDAAFDDAIATLGRQLERFPQGKLGAEAHYYRAEACYARQRLGDAVQGYRTVSTKHRQHPLRPAALYGLGAAEQERGQAASAGRAFDLLLVEFPAHELAADAHFRRGEICVSLQQFSESEPHFLAAGRAADYADADRARGMILEIARMMHGQEESKTAIEVIDRFIENFSNDPRLDEAYFCRGKWHAETDDSLAAIRDFTRVAEYWPESERAPRALLHQAELLRNLGDNAAAQILLGRFLVNYREHELAPQAHFFRATARYEMEQYAQAIGDINAAFSDRDLNNDPPSDALFLRGMCEAKLNRTDQAIESLQAVLQREPNYVRGDRVLYELAGVYESNNDRYRAARAYHRIVAQFQPSSLCAESHYRIGQWQFEKRDFAGAAQSFRHALERASDSQLKEKAVHQLGWACFSQGKYRAAESAFATQLAEFSGGILAADARMLTAECKYQRQEYGAALVAFSSALDGGNLRPELVEIGLLHGANAAAREKEWSQVVSIVDRYLREFPDSALALDARRERGTALYHLEQFDAARQDFEKVERSDDRVLQAQARFMLGEIHFAEKRYDDAVRAFFQVAYGSDEAAPTEIEPWQADAMFEAARCLEQTERFASAQKLYSELLARFPNSEKAQHARVALQELRTRMR